MEKYIGTKQVEAEPMPIGVAYENGLVRLPHAPSEEDSGFMGFHVRYKDGYESWCPAQAFEESYRIAESPLDRLRIEREELSCRIDKLNAFLSGEVFNTLDNDDKVMLHAQKDTMMEYLILLNARIDRMECGKNVVGVVSFGTAISLLRNGYAMRRTNWNGKGLFVVKQVPAHIESEIIPKMQSLPDSAKDIILREKGFIDYTSQCLIYNTNTGRADSWVPSISDVFAEDWEVVY